MFQVFKSKMTQKSIEGKILEVHIDGQVVQEAGLLGLDRQGE